RRYLRAVAPPPRHAQAAERLQRAGGRLTAVRRPCVYRCCKQRRHHWHHAPRPLMTRVAAASRTASQASMLSAHATSWKQTATARVLLVRGATVAKLVAVWQRRGADSMRTRTIAQVRAAVLGQSHPATTTLPI